MAGDRDEEHDEHVEEGHEDAEGRPRTGLRRRLQRLLDRRELAEDTREVLGGMLEMSDRAKTEAVKLVAREVRNYLDELRITEDIHELVTSHSLEVNLSLHLKPLSEGARQPSDPNKRARREDKPARERPSRERAGRDRGADREEAAAQVDGEDAAEETDAG